MLVRSQDISIRELRNWVGLAKCVLEIGANDGEHTIQLARSFPEAQIHCFECEPRAIAKFEASVHEMNVTLHKVAICEAAGERTFHQCGGPDNYDKSGSLRRPTGHLAYSPGVTFEKTIVVPTATLDSFGFKPDLIWCDTQGNEKFVFEAGRETLRHTRFVKAECHQWVLYDGAWTEDQMLAFFEGWTCLGGYGDDLLLRNDNPE